MRCRCVVVLSSHNYLNRCQTAAWKGHKTSCGARGYEKQVLTAVDTPADAPSPGTLVAFPETTPERPGALEEVAGAIEGGAAVSGEAAACAQCAIRNVAMQSCGRCKQVSYCSKK